MLRGTEESWFRIMTMHNKIRALALLSGGLDGQVAACLVRDQGVDVQGVVFTHPIGDSELALASASQTGIPVEQVDFTVSLVEVFEKCSSLDQSGAQLCLDVHAEMMKRALELADEMDFAFVCGLYAKLWSSMTATLTPRFFAVIRS